MRRPIGQFWEDSMAALRGENKKVIYGPSRRMDYELELSAVIGKPLPYGQTVTAEKAGEHIFGFVMLNDWSGKSRGHRVEGSHKLTHQQPATSRHWR